MERNEEGERDGDEERERGELRKECGGEGEAERLRERIGECTAAFFLPR